MKVECNTIDEFCDELKQELNNLLGKCVRVRIDVTPEQEEQVTFEVGFHATALVIADEGSWLLQFSGIAGCDQYMENEIGETFLDESGRDIAMGWHSQIQDVIEGTDVIIRHGKIEL